MNLGEIATVCSMKWKGVLGLALEGEPEGSAIDELIGEAKPSL